MRLYLKTTSGRGKGFITHDDQEISGLHFKCFSFGANQLVVVDGTQIAIQSWSDRVGDIELIDKTKARTFLTDRLTTYKIEKAAELQAEIDELPAKVIEVV